MTNDTASARLATVAALVLVGCGAFIGGIILLSNVFADSPVASALFVVIILALVFVFALAIYRIMSQARQDYIDAAREMRQLPARRPEQIIDAETRTLPVSAQIPARIMAPKTTLWIKTKGGGVNIAIAQLSKLIDAYPATSRAALDGAIVNGAEDHHRLMEAARALGWLSEGGQGRKTAWNVSQEQARAHLQRLSMETVTTPPGREAAF